MPNWSRNLGVALDKLMVIIIKSKKVLQFSNTGEFRTFSNCINLTALYVYTQSVQNMPKEFHMLKQQCILF